MTLIICCLLARILKELSRRASTFRLIDLAGFYGYCSGTFGTLRQWAFYFDKKTEPKLRREEHTNATNIHSESFGHLHQSWNEPNKLRAASKNGGFGTGETDLDTTQSADLMGFREIGTKRLSTYMPTQVIQPPLDRPKLEKYKSLRTFAPTAARATVRQRTVRATQLQNYRTIMSRLTTVYDWKTPISIFATPQALTTPEGKQRGPLLPFVIHVPCMRLRHMIVHGCACFLAPTNHLLFAS